MQLAATFFVVSLLLGGATLPGRAQTPAAPEVSVNATSNLVGLNQPLASTRALTSATEGVSTVKLRGKVTCPEGTVPGAVVHVNGTKLYVATDAQGEFALEVPSGPSAVEVTCSYVGFRDLVTRLPLQEKPVTLHLKEQTQLPTRDRSAETGWW